MLSPDARASLERARASLRQLAASPHPTPRSGAWTAAQVCLHLVAATECSLTGYPVMRNVLLRATIGRIVLRRFLSRGQMRHGLNAHIPGLPPPDANTPLEAAAARAIAAIDAFERHEGELAPHFVYGRVTHEEFARLHAMHVEDHVRDFALDPQPH